VAGVQAKANGELKTLNSRLNSSNIELAAEKARVQERFDLALEAIQTFHTGVSEEFLLKERQFKGLRERLLTSASDFYGKLAALLKDTTDRPSRQVLLRVNFELAELTGKVGRYEDSLTAHRKVLAAREAMAAGPAVDPEAKVEVGKSLTKVALLLHMMDKTADALATYRQAESVLAKLAGTTPAARAALADCRSAMGETLFRMGKSAEALAAYRLARPEQEALASAPGAAMETRYELGITLFNIDVTEKSPERWSRRDGKLEEDRIQRFTSNGFGKLGSPNHPSSSPDQSGQTFNFVGDVNIGNLLHGTGRPLEAATEFRKAMAVHQKLADDFPTFADCRDGLAKAHNNLSDCLFQEGRRLEAEAELHAALVVWQKLVDEHPAATTLVNNTKSGNLVHTCSVKRADRAR
jgi:tetratricopeptide (TPR) repeat protein